MQTLGRDLDAATGRLRAIAQLSNMIEKQALVMTYNDCFWMLGIFLVAITPVVLLLWQPAPSR